MYIRVGGTYMYLRRGRKGGEVARESMERDGGEGR